MNKYLKLYESHSQYVEPEIRPNVSYCKQENEVHYNPHTFADEYFTTVARENGTFTFTPQNNNVISYSTDNGSTWTQGTSVTVSNGDKVMWKGTMTSELAQGIGNFSSTAEFDVQGNAMSLLYGDNYKGQLDLTEKIYAFDNLFKNSNKIISARNLSLPATTLESGCYGYMFYGCTSLTVAPELPATTLANSCYYSMFQGCTSLTTAPELPATTLAEACYDSMFYNCTSLTSAPELSATTLAQYCYASMFQGCTSLTTAHELPATTLANYCYCNMFRGCKSLNSITCLATDISATNCTVNWVSGVASSGTFVKNANMSSWTTDVNGIPTGWTVQTVSE